MADTNFTDATTSVNGTPIVSSWLDDVNTNTYTILGAIAGTNAITGTGPSTVTVAYPRGVAFRFLPVANNTGAVTINISGLGIRNVTKQGANPLAAGDLVAGSWAYIAYDNTQFQLINPQGPLDATDTYITTAGTSTAYTLPVVGNFTRFSGNAVKMIFHTTNTSTTPTLDVDGTGAAAIKVMSTTGVKIDPIVGAFAANIPATAIWDGTNWLVSPEYPSGRLLNVQSFTATAVYTPTPGTASVIVKGTGSGGGGGGAPATGVGQNAVGAGGGAGAVGETRITSGFAGVTVTIGTAGAGGVGVVGGAGASCSFGALFVLAGGAGGGSGSAGAQSAAFGGVGGTATLGTIVNGRGANGETAISAAATNIMIAGHGATSMYGVGGTPGVANNANQAPGNSAFGFGSGGGGAASGASQPAISGGPGTPGIILVYEYS